MVKFKATKKEMKQGYEKIIGIGYCKAWFLLHYKTPIAYSVNTYHASACDYYDINGVLVSTGYNPINSKNSKADIDLINRYNEQARNIVDGDMSHEDKANAVDDLLTEFISIATAC